jgi:hypothetical protein
LGGGLSPPAAATGEREIDLVAERGDGRVVALDVKFTVMVGDRAVPHLGGCTTSSATTSSMRS